MTNFTWNHDAPHHWNAFNGPLRVGEVTVSTAYNARSADSSVRGSHRSLEAAQAQIEAWDRWRNLRT